MGKTRRCSHSPVLTWFASRCRKHQSKRAEKPHSKFSGRKALNGPATRPNTPLAVENSVGKLAANLAPNAGMGKRAWRTPIPHLVPAQPQGWAGTLCFGEVFFKQGLGLVLQEARLRQDLQTATYR